MSASSTGYDPRGVVTPEAFQVSSHLLGTPLATPGRRLGAVLLDLVFIGILTLVTRSFALVLGVVIAIVLLRAASRRTPVKGNVFDRGRRLAIGCLGVGVGFVTLVVWIGVTLDRNGVFDQLEELEADGQAVVVELDDDGQVTVRRGSDDAEPPDEPVESRDVEALRDGVSLYSTEEALDAYLALLRSGSDTETDRELRAALEARLAEDVAADTLGALQEQVSDLERELTSSEIRREAVEEELEEAEGRGVVGWLLGTLDDLGLGFGWAALYTTVLLTMTNGQTLGKRILGIRVVRLDGERINWWVAFERAGGYAAGFATGLLGFAQVYWDANRQAIHDRIVGTVVVQDGAEPVQDWEAAL